MNDELLELLKNKGANIVKFVDIRELPVRMRRQFNSAVLIGLVLSPEYIYRISAEKITDYSEFGQKENAADRIAEWTADYIIAKGYPAFAQSENNNFSCGFFDCQNKSSVLPHKAVALLSGIGWIGKDNLLVTKEYGSALCMCSVLTNAPLMAECHPMMKPHCGNCRICKDICPRQVIHGNAWSHTTSREDLVDVFQCECCLKCLAYCPWTQRYMRIHCHQNP